MSIPTFAAQYFFNMNFDKNTIIGFGLLAILFFAFFWMNNQSQQEMLKQQKHVQDSIARVNALRQTQDPEAIVKDSLKQDSLIKLSTAGNFATAAIGKTSFDTVENDVMKIVFSNKGGRIESVILKNYKSYNGQQVMLGSTNDILGYNINTGNNSSANTNDLYFTPSAIIKNTDGTQTIQYTLSDGAGQSIVHSFVIQPNNYMVNWNITMQGANRLLTGNEMNFMWVDHAQQMERSAHYERITSNLCFYEGGNFDYISSKETHQFEKPVSWFSNVQQFFNVTWVAKNDFSGGEVKWKRETDDSSKTLFTSTANLHMKIPAEASVTIPMQLYYGPNEYAILKKEAKGMDQIVNLGRSLYAFVRPINLYVIMPVFNFFAGFISNYGWVIFLLTLFIRLITSPLTYSSYLSGAKMKVLKPELDALKQKFGTDQQGFAMEQMKLYREAGVNPLGGCIPALLQVPIFFALYSFFNSNIALRGQPFLWSKDLSSYDVIARLPFSLPFNFGDHISLFTITAVLTSFFISIYNMASTPTQDNPALKYMPYIFPFMMLFFFNGMPSALTWYYTVSNTVTLILQFIIQKRIIDHDKILAKIDQKRKSPKAKTKSKWQERYEQMMESQKKVQELKERTQKKK